MIKPREYNVIESSPKKWVNRILIATPSTGIVRMEWVMARYGQVIPTNWAHVDFVQWMNSYVALNYLVPDAQNLIVKMAVENNFEWLLLIEQDNIIPHDTFLRINDYMRKSTIPVVSGLYFTKSVPPEPLLYRGRGNSFYTNWKLGDKIWVDGIPMGCTLIHVSLLKAMWTESEEYQVGPHLTRKVFSTPANIWQDPENANIYTMEAGTSDLVWCQRIIKEGFFKKAGWPEYEKKKYPFLVDTNIFVKHITEDGIQYPLEIPKEFLKG